MNEKYWNSFCIENFKYLNLYEIDKNISLDNNLNAVFIEFRILENIEFIIKNTILKLKNKCCYTIVCGNINFEFIKLLNNKYNNIINIIKLDINDCDVNDYNNLLLSKDFWVKLKGYKILIYQYDTCIFNDNIDDFINYDFIGAPFYIFQNENIKNIGNGGFSLRTKKVMIDVLLNMKKIQISDNTKKYMEEKKLDNIPEDIFFCNNIIEYNLGNVADYKIAKLFSQELIYNNNSLGGHKWWLYNENILKINHNFNIDFIKIFKCVAIASKNNIFLEEKFIINKIKDYIKQEYIIIIFNTLINDDFIIYLKENFTENEIFYIKYMNWNLLLDYIFIDNIENKLEHFILINNSFIPEFNGIAKKNTYYCIFPLIETNYDIWTLEKKVNILSSYNILVNSIYIKNIIIDYYNKLTINYDNINILYPENDNIEIINNIKYDLDLNEFITFYSNYYNIISDNNDIIIYNYYKNYPSGRLYSKYFIKDELDIEFIKSYYLDIELDNDYKYLKYYIENRDKLIANPKKLINYFIKEKNKIILIYASNIDNINKYNEFRNNVEYFKKIFNDIYYVYSIDDNIEIEEIEDINMKKVKNKCDIYKWFIITEKMDNEYYYCLMNDKTILINNLEPIIDKYFNSDVDILSLTDSYKKYRYKSIYYLENDFRIFNNRGLKYFNMYYIQYRQTFVQQERTFGKIQQERTFGKVQQEQTFGKVQQEQSFKNYNYILEKNDKYKLYFEIKFCMYLKNNNIKYGSYYNITNIYHNYLLNISKMNIRHEYLIINECPLITREYIDYLNIYFNNDITINNVKKFLYLINNGSKEFIEIINNKKIGIVLHIGNILLLDEYIEYLKLIQDKNINYDLYVYDILQDDGIIEKINKIINIEIKYYRVKNKGCDLGSFLLFIDYCIKNKKKYDYIIKLHTKTDVIWRKGLIKPLTEYIYGSLNMFNNNKIGIIASNMYIYELDNLNDEHIKIICDKYKMKYNKKDIKFVAGTMFIIRYDILYNFFMNYEIKIIEEYNLLENGYTVNDTSTYVHAWERIISGFTILESEKIIFGI